jgi:hypothetical protein
MLGLSDLAYLSLFGFISSYATQFNPTLFIISAEHAQQLAYLSLFRFISSYATQFNLPVEHYSSYQPSILNNWLDLLHGY